MTWIRALVIFGLLVSLPGSERLSGAQPGTAPKLLVIVVVDQMRYDYLERMRPDWTSGMKRLVTEGAVFEQNFYPYLNTVTCAGHATIGTGSFPSTHGIIMNALVARHPQCPCTEDATVHSIAYEPNGEAVGHSATQLLVPTMGDRLREKSPASRVVTLSMKPRSAVMLAGHRGVVSWLDDHECVGHLDGLCRDAGAGSAGLHHRQPAGAFRQEVWTRLHGADAYTGKDDAPGEAPPRGWTPVFPHPLAGAPGHAAVAVPLSLGTEPVRRHVSRLDGRVPDQGDEARARRRGGLPRRQLCHTRLRRPCVRS